ncbi:hypothetical protein PSAB6_150030 [Paraburkholderia sabiae]|nr:hypothetical protein PSAB6_150030 [Paraburkholderia sabiae]
MKPFPEAEQSREAWNKSKPFEAAAVAERRLGYPDPPSERSCSPPSRSVQPCNRQQTTWL